MAREPLHASAGFGRQASVEAAARTRRRRHARPEPPEGTYGEEDAEAVGDAEQHALAPQGSASPQWAQRGAQLDQPHAQRLRHGCEKDGTGPL